MISKGHKTAILFFSKSASQEAVAKPLSSNSKCNHRAWDKLRTHSLNACLQSGYQVFRIGISKQRGNSFGERLGNAFDDIFASGFDHVIAIGNDCPDITPELIRKTNQLLSKDGVVAGRDHRGGAWIIGFSSRRFNFDQFNKIAWQTPQLFASIFETFNISDEEGLPTLRDIHSLNDLKKWQSETFQTRLASEILSLLTSDNIPLPKNHSPKTNSYLSLNGMRAPPAA